MMLANNSRFWTAWALACLVLVAAGACRGDPPNADVLATTAEVAALAEEVAGDKVSVRPIVGAGVDPHDYEVSTSDMKRLGAAKIILRNGLGIDAFLDDALAGSGAQQVVTVTEGVKVRQGQDEQGKAEDDPHVWHDPMNDKVMVENIVKALSSTFPEHADTFRKNGDAYKTKFDAVDAEIKQIISTIPAANRKMVTNHDAFGYFIDRYGLTFVGAVIPSVERSQGETSAKQLAELQDTIKREGVKAIFAESSVDPKVAKEIAKDTSIKIVDDLYGDSLAKSGGASTVDGMLLANARKIAEALR